eukprot:SAG11_NODE_3962_length_2132_cov_1.013773_2_plen_124_part_00
MLQLLREIVVDDVARDRTRCREPDLRQSVGALGSEAVRGADLSVCVLCACGSVCVGVCACVSICLSVGRSVCRSVGLCRTSPLSAARSFMWLSARRSWRSRCGCPTTAPAESDAKTRIILKQH